MAVYILIPEMILNIETMKSCLLGFSVPELTVLFPFPMLELCRNALQMCSEVLFVSSLFDCRGLVFSLFLT